MIQYHKKCINNWLSNKDNNTLKEKFIKSQNLYDSVKKCFPDEFK